MERAAKPPEGRHARLAVVGNPDNRRVRLFAEAVAAAGLAAPRVVPWLDVLTGGGTEFAEDEVVRLDSPGEHPEVDRLLRGTADPSRVEGGARWYAGLLAAVRSLRGGVRLDDPDELAVLFDKRRCHHVLAHAGVPVPDSPTSGGATDVRGWDDVRALMRAHRMPRVFLKPAHGSSASGVIALETAGGGRVKATTSVESDGGRLHNSLRVRRITDEREVAALVDALAPDGLHLERWLPKPSAGGRTADLRVLVVAGRATHAVVRTSRWPMTNLHLGGARGDLAAAMDAAGPAWAEAPRICERAAACFPGTLAVGVDLLPAIGWRRFAVAEVNAFGDLLPRLTGLPGSPAEGLDTYAAQLAALTAPNTPFPTPLRGHVPPAAHRPTATPAPTPAPATAPASPRPAEPRPETDPHSAAQRAALGPTPTPVAARAHDAAPPAPAPLPQAPPPPRATPAEPQPALAPDMNEVVGRDDLLLVTLDTLRYDVAVELAAEGRIPNLARHLPGGVWERRHAPGSFTYASHQAIFAGFLPTPAVPGSHPRLFAARFAGSETTAGRTWVFDTPDLVSGLAAAGYHTVCVGGVGFFNRAGALGGVLPGLFAESHWEPEFGVASPTSFEAQVRRVEEVVAAMPPERKLFLFVNVSALHQPNWFHLPGADRAAGDTRETHAAALEYVDRHIGRLLAAASSRRRCFAIVCSDHGTAYGDDGWTGHRIGHEAVWTVPYAHFFLEHREVSA